MLGQVPSPRRGGGLGRGGCGLTPCVATPPGTQNTPPIARCLSMSAGKIGVALPCLPLSLPLRASTSSAGSGQALSHQGRGERQPLGAEVRAVCARLFGLLRHPPSPPLERVMQMTAARHQFPARGAWFVPSPRRGGGLGRGGGRPTPPQNGAVSRIPTACSGSAAASTALSRRIASKDNSSLPPTLSEPRATRTRRQPRR